VTWIKNQPGLCSIDGSPKLRATVRDLILPASSATRKLTVAHRASGWLVTLERVLLHALVRVFSDGLVEYHPKRVQDLRKQRASQGQISKEDLDAIAGVLARKDVAVLPPRFKSTFIRIDWFLRLLNRFEELPAPTVLAMVAFHHQTRLG